jgi:hypothetical protein
MRRQGESRAHEQAKEKVANALRDKGFIVYIDSYPLSCQTEKGERTYWPDIYAENFCLFGSRGNRLLDDGRSVGARRIIVEVQGFTGHQSKAAYSHDLARLRDIRESHGSDIETYAVYLNRRIGPLDIRRWTVDDIEEHLNISK